jgi:hypothetical protein
MMFSSTQALIIAAFIVALTFAASAIPSDEIDTLKSRHRILCVVIAERGHFNPMLHLCMHLAKRYAALQLFFPAKEYVKRTKY